MVKRLLLLLLLTLVLVAERTLAQDLLEELAFASKEPVVAAEATIFGESGEVLRKRAFSEERKAEVIELQPGLWGVRVFLFADDYSQGRRLVAYARTGRGTVLSSRVVQLRSKSQKQGIIAAQCVNDSQLLDRSILESFTTGELKAFTDGRQIAVESWQAELRGLLTPETEQQLQMAERTAGLNYPEPISHDLSVEKLADRLGKLESLLLK